jgi:hypothetical protein
VTVKGRAASYRISEFHRTARSTGGPFEPTRPDPADPRAESLGSQLDDLALMMRGQPHRLATVAEALAVQELVEGMLAGRG